MTKRKLFAIIVAVVLAALCLSAVKLWFTPEVRATLFVMRYGDYVEEKYEKGVVISKDNINCVSMTYYGSKYRHPMIEFDLCGFGIAPSSTYYGCFYSPDDVPLVYGQMKYTLVEKSDGYWTWAEKGGDNHGEVAKIKDCWYYYSASF